MEMAMKDIGSVLYENDLLTNLARRNGLAVSAFSRFAPPVRNAFLRGALIQNIQRKTRQPIEQAHKSLDMLLMVERARQQRPAKRVIKRDVTK